MAARRPQQCFGEAVAIEMANWQAAFRRHAVVSLYYSKPFQAYVPMLANDQMVMKLAKNDQQAARLYKLAAEQGYAPGQYNLGRFYETGRGGLAQNDREAARLYSLAAEQGYEAVGEPMRIVVVRSSQPGCEPKCAEWISAEGSIVLATAEQFRKVVNSLGGKKLPILIHSGGGASDKAMAMGFLIRNRRLDVAVGRTDFDRCANAPGGCNHGT
jgi:TPR repeat protein